MSESFIRAKVRRAVPADIPNICRLLDQYADQKLLLRRTPEDVAFYLGNFVVAELDGRFCGCAAARDFGGDLLELRSLAVDAAFQRRGVGRCLVEYLIADLRQRRSRWKLFTLTYQTDFFQKLGFVLTSRECFPEKIWADCSKCPKHDCCDEVAMQVASENCVG